MPCILINTESGVRMLKAHSTSTVASSQQILINVWSGGLWGDRGDVLKSIIFFLSTNKWPEFEIIQNPGERGLEIFGTGMLRARHSHKKSPLEICISRHWSWLINCTILCAFQDGTYSMKIIDIQHVFASYSQKYILGKTKLDFYNKIP